VLRADLSRQDIRLRLVRRETLGRGGRGRGIIEASEEQEGAPPLQVKRGHLLRLPGDGVEPLQGLTRASLPRVQGSEPEPNHGVIGKLSIELFELSHCRHVPGERQRGSEEIPDLYKLRVSPDQRAEQTHGVRRPIRPEIVLAQR
jgi:hypothetical protein